MMAFPPLVYVALATIALGNGLILPTLPSQNNDLSRAGDPRRPWAYNVYYVGVNVGGFLAPLICGTLGELYGWHWGFTAAGIGMLGGLLIYLAGGKYLPPEEPPGARAAASADAAAPRGGRDVWLLLLAVGLAVTVFRGAYEQLGNTVALWADTGVDRALGDLTIPMTWFQSLNPLLVILMTPALLARWKRRAAAGREHTPMQKMAIGAFIVCVAYLLLAGVAAASGEARASWLWLALFFVVATLGELYILPNGLGLFARLAPPRLGATTVAAWYLAIFTGSLTAGLVGTLWSRIDHGVFFALLGAIAAAAGGLLLLLDRPAARVIGDTSRPAEPLQAEPQAPAPSV
jgi:POT family proton-dependent oligopeptide transporter